MKNSRQSGYLGRTAVAQGASCGRAAPHFFRDSGNSYNKKSIRFGALGLAAIMLCTSLSSCASAFSDKNT